MTRLYKAYYIKEVSSLMDKISVIVPVYNTEKYLNDCISSILKQSYPNIELILVNDGSTDGTFSICQQYADKYNNIKLINQERVGQSEARNTGLQYATGELITFVDADDWIEKDYLMHLSTQMRKYNSDIAITCYYQYYQAQNNFGFFDIDSLSHFKGVHRGYEWTVLRFQYETYAGGVHSSVGETIQACIMERNMVSS